MPGSQTAPEAAVVDREQLAPLYNVVLLDDDLHTYDYVVEMLQKLFLFSESEAFQHALEVDTAGRTVVITCDSRRRNSRVIKSAATARIGGCRSPRVRCRRSSSLPPANDP